MNLIQRMKRGLQQRLITLLDLDRMIEHGPYGLGTPTWAGVKVDEAGSMKYAAVYACVRIIAETLASLPLITYQKLEPRGRRRATELRLYELLHDRPNPEMTSFSYREASQAHLLLWGNAYSEIETDNNGEVVGLWPLPPWRVEPFRSEQGNVFYKVRLGNGKHKVLPAYRVLHVPGLGFNGLQGLSPIGYARQAVGLGLALEEFGARFFGQGTHLGGIVKHPGSIGGADSKGAQNLVGSITDWAQGVSKSHRILLLEEGADYQSVGIPPEAAQFLETKVHQKREIAMIFNVPLHMLADMEKGASFKSIEQKAQDFIDYTMRPWFVRWEQALRWKLLGQEQRRQYYMEFLADALLRGDIETRYRAYATAKQWGWMSSNDILEMENRNPVEGGDIYLMPLNMIPVEQAGQQPDGQQRQAPTVTQFAYMRNGKVVTDVRDLLQTQATATNEDGSAAENAPPPVVGEVERRSLLMRRRLAQTYELVFQDAAQRVINREVHDIKQAVQNHLRNRSEASFVLWLDRFYEEAPDWIRRSYAPAITSYAETIIAEAGVEIGAELEQDNDDLQKFTADYLDGMVLRHVIASRRQVNAWLRDGALDNQDVAEVVDVHLDDWTEVRAGKVAMEEPVRAGSAFALAAWVVAGVTRKRWVTVGDNCPWCDAMDGRIVEIQSSFWSKGQGFEVDGEDGTRQTMTFSSNVGHPPLHGGCDCQIASEFGGRDQRRPTEEVRAALQQILEQAQQQEVPENWCACGHHH